MRRFLRDRQRILWTLTVAIALGFVAMQLLRTHPSMGKGLYFLIMTASLPIGPIVDLFFFKIGNDYPRLGWLFSILLPVLVTVGTYMQWKFFIPWGMARLARIRRERSRKPKL